MLKKTSQYHLIYAILALGIGCSACNSESQPYEGWLKYDSKACVNSGGIYDSHDANREKSTCECNDKSGVVCYESWLCDQDNNSCKECKAGESTCFNGEIQTCIHGKWTVKETCDTGKCNKDNTACIAESLCETKCENNILTTCSNNDEQEDKFNQIKTQCPYGCDGKRCKSCDESYKCDNNTLTRCGVKIVECKNGCDNVNGTDVCTPDSTIPGWDEKCQPNESKCVMIGNGAKQYQCVEGHWSEVLGIECKGCSADATVCTHCTENKCDGDKLKKCQGGKYEEVAKPKPECSCQDGAWNCPGECPQECPNDCTEGVCNPKTDECPAECLNDCTEGVCNPKTDECPDECPEDCTNGVCNTQTDECPTDCPNDCTNGVCNTQTDECPADCPNDCTEGVCNEYEDVPKQGEHCSEVGKFVCEDNIKRLQCQASSTWQYANCKEAYEVCDDGECKCTKHKCIGDQILICDNGKYATNLTDCEGECDEVKGCVNGDNPCNNVGEDEFSCLIDNGDLRVCLGKTELDLSSWPRHFSSCGDLVNAVKPSISIDMESNIATGCYKYSQDDNIQFFIISKLSSGDFDSGKYSITYCANGCNDGGSCNIVTTDKKCDERSYFCDEHVLKCIDGSEEKNVTSDMVSNEDLTNYLDYCLKGGDKGYNCVQNVPSNEGKELKEVCHPDDVEGFCHDDKAYLFDFPNTGLNIKDCAYCESVGSEWKFISKNGCRCEDISNYPQCNGSDNQLICQDGIKKSEPCGKNGTCDKDKNLGQCIPSAVLCIDGYLRCNQQMVQECNVTWISKKNDQRKVLMYEYNDTKFVMNDCQGNKFFECSGSSCEKIFTEFDSLIKNKSSSSIPLGENSVTVEMQQCYDSVYNHLNEGILNLDYGSKDSFMLELGSSVKVTYCEKGCDHERKACKE